MACVADSARANHISYLNCSEANLILFQILRSPMIFSRAAKERNDSFFFPNSPFSWSQLVSSAWLYDDCSSKSYSPCRRAVLTIVDRSHCTRSPCFSSSSFRSPIFSAFLLPSSPPSPSFSLSRLASSSLSRRAPSASHLLLSVSLSLALFSSPFRPRRQALVFFCVRALRVCVHRP